jgi:3-oxoacyl-[acyl-carrier-protein] synthase II
LKKKVVITGYGVVSSVGIGEDEYWNSLLHGKSNIRPIEAFDSSLYRSSLGAEPDWGKVDLLLNKIKKFDVSEETTKLSILSTHEAFQMANLYDDSYDSSRAACIVGTLCSSSRQQERLWKKNADSDEYKNDAEDSTIVSYQADAVAEHFGIEGPTSLVSTACASFIDAYGFALDLIRDGKCDIAVVVGGDIISEAVHAGFNCVYSITQEVPRPFDADRTGFIIGEGAATVILESEEHALARGCNIHAEAMGYGGSNSAFHLTSPSDSGEPEALAMKRALIDANVEARDIDYVLAHGTGTQKNDKTELLAVSQALETKSRDKNLKITSIKGSIGHCMGAAGAMSLVATLKSIQDNVIPMTANVNKLDETFDLVSNIELVWKKSLEMPVNFVLVNSLGFAGNNAVAIVGRYS